MVLRLGTGVETAALALFQEGTMSKNFDPAPLDKHAEKAGPQGRGADKYSDELEKGLEESFPASDPAASTQPHENTKPKK
jgi:hypothetical protein